MDVVPIHPCRGSNIDFLKAIVDLLRQYSEHQTGMIGATTTTTGLAVTATLDTDT
jgi:hypothetical protein